MLELHHIDVVIPGENGLTREGLHDHEILFAVKTKSCNTNHIHRWLRIEKSRFDDDSDYSRRSMSTCSCPSLNAHRESLKSLDTDTAIFDNTRICAAILNCRNMSRSECSCTTLFKTSLFNAQKILKNRTCKTQLIRQVPTYQMHRFNC